MIGNAVASRQVQDIAAGCWRSFQGHPSQTRATGFSAPIARQSFRLLSSFSDSHWQPLPDHCPRYPVDPYIVFLRSGRIGKAQSIEVHAIAVLGVGMGGLAVDLVGHGAQLLVTVAVLNGDRTGRDTRAYQGYALEFAAGGAEFDVVAIGYAQPCRVGLVDAHRIVRVHLAQA